jgi:hypothetical protein
MEDELRCWDGVATVGLRATLPYFSRVQNGFGKEHGPEMVSPITLDVYTQAVNSNSNLFSAHY